MFGKKDPAKEMAELREQRAKLAAKLQEMVQAVAGRDEALARKGRAIEEMRDRVERLTATIGALRDELDAAKREMERLRARR